MGRGGVLVGGGGHGRVRTVIISAYFLKLFWGFWFPNSMCLFRAASTLGAPKALQSLPVEAGLPHLEFSKFTWTYFDFFEILRR